MVKVVLATVRLGLLCRIKGLVEGVLTDNADLTAEGLVSLLTEPSNNLLTNLSLIGKECKEVVGELHGCCTWLQ